jgi:flagellar biosynthesis/type III secretory pathway chaperone
MKKLLFEDKHRIDSETVKLEMAKNELNIISDFFKANELGKLSQELIKKFLKDGIGEAIREIYKSRIPDVDPTTKLRNRKDDILDRMELPNIKAELGYIRLCANDLSLFDFAKEVTLNSDRLEKHLDIFRYYSDNTEVIAAYNELTDLTERLNKLNARLRFFPLGHNIGGITHDYNLSEIFVITPSGFELQQAGFQKAIKNLSK